VTSSQVTKSGNQAMLILATQSEIHQSINISKSLKYYVKKAQCYITNTTQCSLINCICILYMINDHGFACTE